MHKNTVSIFITALYWINRVSSFYIRLIPPTVCTADLMEVLQSKSHSPQKRSDYSHLAELLVWVVSVKIISKCNNRRQQPGQKSLVSTGSMHSLEPT